MAPDSPARLAPPPPSSEAGTPKAAPANTAPTRLTFNFLATDRTYAARSLFSEILDWLWVPVMLLMPISLMLTFGAAKLLSNPPYDRALADNLEVLAAQVKVRGGRAVADVPLAARELLRADEIDTVYFQVVGLRGEFVAGDRDLPQPPDDEVPNTEQVQYRDEELNGVEIRIAYRWVEIPAGAAPARGNGAQVRPALVQVAETLEKRAQLADEIIKGVILPQFIVLPLGVVLIWLGLARGLKPMTRIIDRIQHRKPGDLSPIDANAAPTEMRPLIASVNALMQQLDASLKGQQRFIANAAHQLRTPLAGIKMQAELALRQAHTTRDPDELKRSLEQMRLATSRAARMVNQLLALTRAEHGGGRATGTGGGRGQPAMSTLDLAALARERLAEWVTAAREKGIDIGFESATGGPLLIAGNASLLAELMNNLIDNAIRYTPVGGRVTVKVRGAPQPTLEVEDSGVGIAPDERSLVFERFYRVLGGAPGGENIEGSGLGLAIVREIAQQHGAVVRIADRPAMPGLAASGTVFVVEFNANPNPPH